MEKRYKYFSIKVLSTLLGAQTPAIVREQTFYLPCWSLAFCLEFFTFAFYRHQEVWETDYSSNTYTHNSRAFRSLYISQKMADLGLVLWTKSMSKNVPQEFEALMLTRMTYV